MTIMYFDVETYSGKKEEFKPSMIEKIITIQYKDIEKDLVVLKEWESSEKRILKDFSLSLKKLVKEERGVQIIGHNILRFDIPNLIQRMSINNVDSTPNLLDLFHKTYLIDTLQCILSHNNFRFKGLSAEDIAKKLDIRGPVHRNDEIDGFYEKGEFLTHLSVFAQAKGLEPEKERKALELMLMQAKKSIDNATISFWQPGTFGKVVLFFAVEEKEGAKP
jgi:hypothetical protein